jgi:hypothetical protein
MLAAAPHRQLAPQHPVNPLNPAMVPSKCVNIGMHPNSPAKVSTGGMVLPE